MIVRVQRSGFPSLANSIGACRRIFGGSDSNVWSFRESTNSVLEYQTRIRSGIIVFIGLLAGLATTVAGAGDLPIVASGLGSTNVESSLMTLRSMESSGALIASVSIANSNIFDLDDPEENKALYRLANKLHVTTRQNVIQQQLLFAPGERLSLQRLEETERLLRNNRYIQTASVRPTIGQDGSVNVEVETSDVWTLMPKISFSRSGGENRAAIGIKETNLLGTGIAVELAHKSNVDRDSTLIKFMDRHLAGSWYSLGVFLAENSDGHSRFIQLEKPFYSLNSESSGGGFFLDDDQVDSFYDRGVRQSEYRHETTKSEVYRGWSHGLVGGYSRRVMVGLAQDEHRFSAHDMSDLPAGVVPLDRKFLYPFIGFEILEDDYEKASNVNQIGRTEDRFLGTRLSGRVGVAAAGAGSDRNALLLNASAQTGFGSSDSNSLLLTAGLGARVEDSGIQNLSLATGAKYTRRQSKKRLFYVGLDASFGHNLDLDQLFEMGGDTGLRGYPLRYQTGDKRAVLTVEQRYFTDWHPFRLFRVGGAVFFDAGRVWGEQPGSSAQAGLLRDVGFGLRIASDRSGFGRMTHIDIAFPLDGDQQIDSVQLVISTKKSF